MPPPTATLQTAPGRGGIAVIVLAGDGCTAVLAEVFRPRRSHTLGGEGVLQLGQLVDGPETIDEAIVCAREGACEINIHGGPAAARRALQALAARGATVLPAPAAAAESFPLAHPRWGNPAVGAAMLAALARARSERVAAAVTQQWSAGLSELAAEALAAIEHKEVDDSLPARLQTAADGLAVMQRLMDPAEVVLAGPPNVGKSTLANALVGRQVALVHATAGTTRDWVRELAVLNGIPVWLTDTAGLWEAKGDIDAEAVARARHRTEQADLVLLLSAGRVTGVPEWLHAQNVLGVWAKADRTPPPADFPGPAVSGRTGAGLEELAHAIVAALGLGGFEPAAPRAFTPRQAELLIRAADALRSGDTVAARQSLRGLLT